MDSSFITKSTKIYLSLCEQPGESGTRLFNQLFSRFSLNCIYKACRVEQGKLKRAMDGLRVLKIAGGGVSMPFKNKAVEFVDHLSSKAKRIGAINTFRLTPEGTLEGFNTDYVAVKKAMISFDADEAFVFGCGGVARAACVALLDCGVKKIFLVARNQKEGSALALRFGVEYLPWAKMKKELLRGILINCTPLGMPGHAEFKVFENWWPKLRGVIDLPLNPKGTALWRACEQRQMPFISGERFTRWQAVAQFEIYSGIRLNENLEKEVREQP